MKGARCSHAKVHVRATRSESVTAIVDGDAVQLGPDPVELVTFTVICYACEKKAGGTEIGLSSSAPWAIEAIHAVRSVGGQL